MAAEEEAIRGAAVDFREAAATAAVVARVAAGDWSSL